MHGIRDCYKLAALDQPLARHRLWVAATSVGTFPGEVSEWLKEHAWKVCVR